MRGNFGKLLAGFVALPENRELRLDLYDDRGNLIGSAFAVRGSTAQTVHYTFDVGSEPVAFILDESAPPMSLSAWVTANVDERKQFYLKAELNNQFGGSFRSLAS